MFGVFSFILHPCENYFFPEGMGVYIIVVEITCIYMQVVKNGNSGLRKFPSEVGVWIFSGTTCTQTKSFLLIYIKRNLTSMQRPRSNVKLHIGQTNLSANEGHCGLLHFCETKQIEFCYLAK